MHIERSRLQTNTSWFDVSESLEELLILLMLLLYAPVPGWGQGLFHTGVWGEGNDFLHCIPCYAVILPFSFAQLAVFSSNNFRTIFEQISHKYRTIFAQISNKFRTKFAHYSHHYRTTFEHPDFEQ